MVSHMADLMGNSLAQVVVCRCSAWYGVITIRSSGKLGSSDKLILVSLGCLTLNEREPGVVVVG